MKPNLNIKSLLNLWHKMSLVPGGALLYSKMLGKLVPYTGSTGMTIVELKPGYAKIQMNDRRSVRNHLGSIHAAALMNFAEAASGLALNHLLPENARAILVGFNVQYTKKARGTLTAVAEVKIDPITDSRDEVITSTVTDKSGATVALAKATWRIGLNK